MARLRELVAAGASITAIANDLDRSYNSVLEKAVESGEGGGGDPKAYRKKNDGRKTRKTCKAGGPKRRGNSPKPQPPPAAPPQPLPALR